MRLTVRQVKLLHKAGKQGLVAVQKQVTKKGKTFTQTFYVKPSEVPKAKGRLRQHNLPFKKEEIKATRPTITVEDDEGNLYTFIANNKEGFLIDAGYGAAPVKIPEQYIAKTFKYKGQTFVVHRVIDVNYNTVRGRYQTTELTTGRKMSIESESVEGAEEEGKKTIDNYTEDTLQDTLDKSEKMINAAEIVTGVENWESDEPRAYMNDAEFDESAREIWNTMLEGEDGGLTLDQVKEWMNGDGDLETREDVETVLNSYDDTYLRDAISLDMPYDDAETRRDAIDEIQELITHSDAHHYGQKPEWNDVATWAEDNEDNLTEGFDNYQYGTASDYGNEWSAADVVAYAYYNNTDLYSAQEQAGEATMEQDAESEQGDMEDIEVTDSKGVYWSGEDLAYLSNWVGGGVEYTREAANSLDDCRRMRAEKKTGSECENDNDVVNVIESNSVKLESGIIYRGTGNEAWLDGKIGDNIVVGCASYSKSESMARSFSSTVLLIVDASQIPKDNPVRGVDIDQLIRDADEEHGNIGDQGIAAYRSEQEFIVRAPMMTITKREGNKVWVSPIEMDLLSVMKSIFADKAAREAAMAETFKYHMRQDTEDKWVS